ncbi:MAG: hypothetical protein L6R36_007400 [Xanthoria steineri]|nr:MAG: hypothetical protein L6R36_007400 [Xanthoria steineri]
MSTPPSQSKTSGSQESSPQSHAPTTGNYIPSPRSSTGSTVSVADVEAGFLPGGAGRKQNSWKDRLPFRVFAKRVLSSDTESTTTENPEKKVTRYRWLSIILLVALLGITAAFLGREIPRHRAKPINRARSLATWPADSRDVHPIPCHSHNDYLRPVPLFDALAAGCTSVEADVWVDSELQNDLYVGHTRKSLQRDRTLNSLYIDPLLAILNEMNTPANLSSSSPPNARADNNTTTVPAAGVFETFPHQPITLLIDLKTASESTFPTVLAALQPLLRQNYLTTWSAERGLIPGPITVVGTGNTDFTSAILGRDNTAPRLVFFDAPLAALDDPTDDQTDYNTTNSLYASVSYAASIGKSFLGIMTPGQMVKVRRQIAAAGEKGLRSRYWDTPSWPKGVRDGVWDVLVKEGVGILSVDDLEGVRGFWGGRGG